MKKVMVAYALGLALLSLMVLNIPNADARGGMQRESSINYNPKNGGYSHEGQVQGPNGLMLNTQGEGDVNQKNGTVEGAGTVNASNGHSANYEYTVQHDAATGNNSGSVTVEGNNGHSKTYEKY